MIQQIDIILQKESADGEGSVLPIADLRDELGTCASSLLSPPSQSHVAPLTPPSVSLELLQSC